MSERPAEPVVLLTARDAVEAHSIVAMLADAGVEATTLDAAHLGAGTPLAEGARRVPVRVPPGDLERARETVRTNLTDPADIDWETVDVGERIDALPLRTPGRMPLPARIAFVITVLVVLVAIVAGVIALVV